MKEIIKAIIVWLILITIMFMPRLFGQKKYELPKFKSYVTPGIFIFLSGMSDGARDGFMFRADGMGKFWNGKASWTNKYKNNDVNAGEAYFGSTTFLAFTTDAPHLSNFFTHQFQSWSYVFMPYDNNRKFGHLLLKGLAINGLRQLGHTATYSLFRQKRY